MSMADDVLHLCETHGLHDISLVGHSMCVLDSRVRVFDLSCLPVDTLSFAFNVSSLLVSIISLGFTHEIGAAE